MSGLAHFGFGFLAKPLAPRVPLAVWLVGSELLDILAITLPLIGAERPNEAYWSHSLLMAAVWGLAFGGVVGGVSRSWRAGLLGFGVVVMHWALDAIVWPMTTIYPDRASVVMPWLPGNPAGVGLGLYRSLPATIITEAGLFGLGVLVYVLFMLRKRRAGLVAGTPPASGPSIS